MSYSLRTLMGLTAGLPMLIAAAWYTPDLSGVSNCGGNNAARPFVEMYAATMIRLADEMSTREFTMAAATVDQRRELAAGSSGWGISRSDILVKRNTVRLGPTAKRQIIVVCDRAFTNVPR